MTVMLQIIGEVEAALIPDTAPPAGVTPPTELKDTVPLHEPPVMVSPVNPTESEGTKVRLEPPPPPPPPALMRALGSSAGYI